MNIHLYDGQLRAALDGELNKNELAHLANCAICRSRQEELESQLQFASDKLAFLASAPNASRLSSTSAWSRFKQMYKGEADWSLIAQVKNNPRMHSPIFGNGDIDTPQKALEYKNRYEVDGVMIGRAAIGYPWIFDEIKHYVKTGEIRKVPGIEERIIVIRKHIMHSLRWKGPKLGILEMRPHYANYLKGLSHLKEFRMQLVHAEFVGPNRKYFRFDG